MTLNAIWIIITYLEKSGQDIRSSAIAKKFNLDLHNASNFHFIELWLVKLVQLMYPWTKKK